ncbi:type IV toxin-antitoxin system AbiEi family antitoxin domain-containing protein [Levilinea saccharolytica]|uniref:Transcriptional regulator n=1 Tax=Levilinea saccharolytica TaxID=229921 RepID=A0A0P6Y3T8_9CHLR|nr:hypothetical protein [Levilinea saccharolytica]KPL79636.1 hypothetical protein ADN01_14250 [Levilinea saccharolytica]GAP17327.1 hypothetical protein LSAC_01196 [Levilinea saccharolytica]
MKFSALLKLVGDDPIFTSSLLLSGDVNPRLIRIQLSRWVKAGKICRIRRGLYAIAPPFQKQLPHPFRVANFLQKASYVSLQSTLSFYGLIPEVMNITTSVSTNRPERLETALGTFEFRHIKRELLFGYQMIDLGGQSAFVADPEKALLDLVYFQPGGDLWTYLKELRLQNLEKLDPEYLTQLSKKYNTRKMQNAANLLLQLISRDSEEFEDL